jgi:four helix bundle protein
MSLGSCRELKTELAIAKEIGFGTIDKYQEIENLLEEIQKMIQSMISKLKAGS